MIKKIFLFVKNHLWQTTTFLLGTIVVILLAKAFDDIFPSNPIIIKEVSYEESINFSFKNILTSKDSLYYELVDIELINTGHRDLFIKDILYTIFYKEDISKPKIFISMSLMNDSTKLKLIPNEFIKISKPLWDREFSSKLSTMSDGESNFKVITTLREYSFPGFFPFPYFEVDSVSWIPSEYYFCLKRLSEKGLAPPEKFSFSLK